MFIIFKRIFDITFSILLLLIFFIINFIINNDNSIRFSISFIYTGKIGLNGKSILIIKLKTMRSSGDNKQITLLGKFLRSLKLMRYHS